MNPSSITLPPAPGRALPTAEAPTGEDGWPLGLSVAVTSVGHAVCHLAELIFPGVMVAVMVELGIGPALAGGLALLGYILMGVGAFPVGLWCDAWGPVPVLKIYFFAVAGSAVAVACSPNAWVLFAALTALGLAVSIYHPAGLALLSLHKKARGRALGFHGVAGSVGVALGPFLGKGFAELGVWRVAYVVVAGLSLLAGLGFLLLARLYTPPARERPVPAPASQPITTKPLAYRRYLPLAFFLLAMMIGGFNYRCLMTALPTFLDGSVPGGELIQGVLPVLIALSAGALGQMLSGWAADSFGARRVYLVVMALMIPTSLALGYAGGTAWALPMACLVAVCLFGQQPAENSLLADLTPAGRRGLSYATKFTLTFGVGALGTAVTGVIWEYNGSPAPVFPLIAGGAVVMVGCWFAAVRVRAPEVPTTAG